MKIENIVKTRADFRENPSHEPLWPFEAASLVRKIELDTRLEFQRSIDSDPVFAEKARRYLSFEENVMREGKQVLDRFPLPDSVVSKSIQESGKTFFSLLDIVAAFLFYETQGTIENRKRLFFASILTDFTEQDEKLPMEDFECFYRRFADECDDSESLKQMLDFHLHFEERFAQLADLLGKITEVIRNHFHEVKALFPPLPVEETLRQVNTLLTEQKHRMNYSVKHLFPGYVMPTAISLLDNRMGEPLLVAGVMAYEYSLFESGNGERSLERKVSCLKAMGDPVRYRILLKSKDQPVYLSELAREFGLKPATVSHHLSVLASEGFLQFDLSEVEDRKVYYSLNREMVHNVVQALQELL